MERYISNTTLRIRCNGDAKTAVSEIRFIIHPSVLVDPPQKFIVKKFYLEYTKDISVTSRLDINGDVFGIFTDNNEYICDFPVFYDKGLITIIAKTSRPIEFKDLVLCIEYVKLNTVTAIG